MAVEHTPTGGIRRFMMRLTLNAIEMEILFRQDPTTQRNGGYQGLLVRLQKNTDRGTD
jgi:hypothetical protein